MAESSSTSSSSSSSTSSPQIMNSPASDWELSLSQAIAQQAQQQYQWAQGAYAQLGQITDQQINNFLSITDQAKGLAGGMIDRYNSVYAPRETQFAKDADSYAGPERMAHEMGGAESRAAQAGKAGEINAERELQSFGIDPSSGRYQDLIRASNTANSASAAAAGEAARRDTEAAGRQMKLQSIQIGQQLPGAAVNAMNTAYQGISGAENAALGRANTGVNLMQAGDKNNATAMGLKYPPVVPNTKSQSNSTQQGQSNNPSQQRPQQPGSQGGGPQGGGNGGVGQGGYNPGGGGGQPGGNTNIPRGMSSGAHIMNLPGGGQDQQGYDQLGGYNPNDPYSNLDQNTRDIAGVYNDNGWQSGANQYDPNAGFGGTTQDMWGSDPYYTGSFGNTNSGGGDWGIDPNTNYSGWDSSYGGSTPTNSFTDPSYTTPDANWGGSGDGGGSSDWQDYGGSSGSDDYYAQGGGVVPASMSPSGGQQTDDVQANIPQSGGRAQLNVDEFVIPKDVAMWKGQEFFQKLIAQSRQARTGAPAKPTRGGQNAQQ